MRYTFLLLIWLLLQVSCGEKPAKDNTDIEQEEEAVNLNHKFYENYLDGHLRQRHIDSVINKGDTTAYKNFQTDYSYSGHRNEFLLYSMIMAKQHNYSRAYFDVYSILQKIGDSITLSDDLKMMKHYYLLKSYQLGFKSSEYYIKEEFGESYDSLKLMKRLEVLEMTF